MQPGTAPTSIHLEMGLIRTSFSDGHEPRVAAFMLLALIATMSLAGALAWSRRGVSLGDVRTPDGWRISYRPPAHWRELNPDQLGDDVRAYDSGGPSNRKRLLILQRDTLPPARTPEKLVTLFMAKMEPPATTIHAGRAQIYSAPFGPFPGATMENEASGVIVSAAYVDGESYGVALVSNARLAARDRKVARSVVDSVDYAP